MEKLNVKCRAVTESEYKLIIDTISKGFTTSDNIHIKGNRKAATALILEANLGMRIGDIMSLKLSNIIKDGDKYRLDIIEQKTGKKRKFLIPVETYSFILNYALQNGIKPNAKLFNVSVRTVQRILQLSAEHLGFKNVGTHSFRKFFAVSIYNNNNYNLCLIKELLQHAHLSSTEKYLSVSNEAIENAIQKHIVLPTT